MTDPGPAPTSPETAPAGTTLPVASGREARRAVVRLARPHRRLVAAGAGILVAATLASLSIPLLLGAIVDVVVGDTPESRLNWLVLGLVAATTLQGVLFGAGAWAVGRIGELLMTDLREDVVDRALAVPIDQVERAGVGDLVARACGDVDAVAEAAREAIPEIVASTLIIGLTVVGLATLDLRLALAGLAALPVQALTSRWYLRRSRPIYAAERAAEGLRSQRLHTSVTGARTIRALRLHDDHVGRVTDTSRRAVDLAVSAAAIRARFFSGLNAAELVGLTAVLAVSYPLVQSDALTVGGATAAALYFYRLFDPVGVLLSQLDTLQSAGAALARLVGVTSLPAPTWAAAATPGTSTSTSTDGDGETGDDRGVRLTAVTFAYDDARPVLHGVDIEVGSGQRVALVGPSGAGKTTVAKLVSGIYRPAEGTVGVGGADVATLDPAARARQVALVTQEVHVFTGPLAADLRLARPDASDDDLWAALDAVGARPWVEVLDDGLETVVGDGGHRVSPTEAQQVALARLLLADPRVAILDEATAEAGSAGAGVLDDAAAAAVAGRTALVIAHRLSQAATADRIVVLDGGRVVEDGTHDELLAAGGLYAGLWRAWAGAAAPRP